MGRNAKEPLMKIRKSHKFLLAVIGSYLLSYLMLMRRDWPAYDKTERIAFRSACRFAPFPFTQKSSSRLTIVVGRVTFLNYLFYPLDFVYYRIRGLSPTPASDADPEIPTRSLN